MQHIATDGSSPADAHERVVVDTDDTADAWRYRCPAGHLSYSPTNGGIWCRACSHDDDIDDPHWRELLDVKTGDTVPWSAVELR